MFRLRLAIVNALQISRSSVYEVRSFRELSSLLSLEDVAKPHHRFPPQLVLLTPLPGTAHTVKILKRSSLAGWTNVYINVYGISRAHLPQTNTKVKVAWQSSQWSD